MAVFLVKSQHAYGDRLRDIVRMSHLRPLRPADVYTHQQHLYGGAGSDTGQPNFRQGDDIESLGWHGRTDSLSPFNAYLIKRSSDRTEAKAVPGPHEYMLAVGMSS